MPKVPSLVVVGLLVCLPAGALAGCAKDEPVTSSASTAPTTKATPSSAGTTPGTRATGTTGTAVPATAKPGTTAPTAPSTAPTTQPPRTAPPGSSTPTAPAPTTPDGFAKALVEAWKAGDQAAATQVAEAPAVAKLFAAADQDPASYVFLDCGGAAGSTICRFNSGSETLLVSVRNTTGGLPMIVTDVRITGAGG